MTFRALDLYCKAGGVSEGLRRAGFEVVAVDHEWQPRHRGGLFVQADALRLPFDLSAFDFVWASPPCKRYTILTRLNKAAADYPNLIPPTRQMLLDQAVPLWCIENVPGAPLRVDLVLQGGEFDLDIIRRRHFELHGFRAFTLHRQQMRKVSDGGLATVAGKGANNAWNVRRARDMLNGVYNDKQRVDLATKWRDLPEDLKDALRRRNNRDGWRAAMGIDWMSRDELAQAIPPAYAEFIGRAAIEELLRRRSRVA